MIQKNCRIYKKLEIFFSPNLTPAYRQQYGSVNPAAIVATAVSTGAAVVYCKVKDLKRNNDIW